MTICELDHADYLLRRIRGDQDPVQTAAAAVQGDMSRITLQMIDRLDWRDFETLIELIFTRGGWQRTSELGKNQADVDLVLVQPITREKAWVQIKSTADQRQLDDYLDRFFSDSGCERFFFVYHKARGRLSMSHERRSPQHRADI